MGSKQASELASEQEQASKHASKHASKQEQASKQEEARKRARASRQEQLPLCFSSGYYYYYYGSLVADQRLELLFTELARIFSLLLSLGLCGFERPEAFAGHLVRNFKTKLFS